MKHDDCVCSECRAPKVAPLPSSTITIPLADAAKVIADSVRAVLESHDYTVIHMGGRFGKTLDAHEFSQLLGELGRNTAAELQGLDESPIEEPAPLARSRGRR